MLDDRILLANAIVANEASVLAAMGGKGKPDVEGVLTALVENFASQLNIDRACTSQRCPRNVSLIQDASESC